MKLIECMKRCKDLARKQADLMGKIKQHCAHLSFETPTYGAEQKATVLGWVQSSEDISKEVLKLRTAIQRTNLATSVKIELGGVIVEKTIAEWIHRRRDLAKLDEAVWACLTDRGLKEGKGKTTTGDEFEAKIVRNFDPVTRDSKLELYRSEPMTIDSTLEVVNAVTSVIETDNHD
jgi:hypothetical protein